MHKLALKLWPSIDYHRFDALSISQKEEVLPLKKKIAVVTKMPCWTVLILNLGTLTVDSFHLCLYFLLLCLSEIIHQILLQIKRDQSSGYDGNKSLISKQFIS